MVASEIVLLIILIVFSGFFSGIETAITSISNLKIRHLVEKRRRGAKSLKKLIDNRRRFLITILIGNNFVNVAASAIATAMAINIFGNIGVGIATGVMTFLILFFGEITPKNIAITHAEKISLVVAKPIYILEKILWPIIIIFEFLTKLISPKKTEEPLVSEEELKSIVNISEEEGSINPLEKDMIQKIFRFNDIEVKEIMTPRTDMVVLEVNSILGDVIKTVKERGHTRIPVYNDRIDNITGILLVKDILKLLEDKTHQELDNFKLRDMIKKAYFVPENKIIDTLLRDFQRKKVHMAIVVDEHGGVAGLVTIEDLLEEIVGEIFDEKDKVDPLIQKHDENTYFVKGRIDLDELNQRLGLKLKATGDFETLGGYILEKMKKIPKESDVLEENEVNITIEEVEKNRIIVVKLEKK